MDLTQDLEANRTNVLNLLNRIAEHASGCRGISSVTIYPPEKNKIVFESGDAVRFRGILEIPR